ncbi:MAG: rod shape-determining protein RodA [Gemmatimonadota bacterium]|nr:rod shape-determining protein RodA [Gemmatimonadota bacterium]
MKRARPAWSREPRFALALLALSLWGLAMIYSAGVLNVPSPVTQRIWMRHGALLVAALMGFAVVARVPTRWFEWISLPAFIFWTAVLGVTLAVGTGAGTASGVKAFLSIGGFRFQPSEAAKIATILYLARVLSSRDRPPRDLRDLLTPAAIVGVPLALVVLQPDLGTALAFLGILFASLFWAGTPWPILLLLASPGFALVLSFDTRLWSAYVILLFAGLYLYRFRLDLAESVAVFMANVAAGTIAGPLWSSLASYQKNRILVFLDPSVDPQGAGWQLIQSKVAVGSGGLFGKGFTLGTQKRLDFLPEQHTDFIFGVVGEEFGFVGTSLTLLVFLYAFSQMIKMAEGSKDPFAGLVIFGTLGAWLTHVFVNVGMTIGLVPITGIPLPFISYGGSFLLMSWLAAGIMIRVANEEP